MTFDQFFAANHKDIPGIDRNTQALMRAAAREGLAACWNAAIDAAQLALKDSWELPSDSPAVTAIEKLKVTK